MARHGSLAEQLTELASSAARPKAANDNKPAKSPNKPRYRGTMPALRWLYDKHPELAKALARELPREPANWFVEVEPSRQEIRPTVGELMSASHRQDGAAHPISFKTDDTGARVSIGSLKFRNGELVEWGATAKGRKLKPKDATRVGGDKSKLARDPRFYLGRQATTPSPLAAHHLHRPFSGEPAIASMYDPLPGVEAARALLEGLGVDGDQTASSLPVAVTLCPAAVAEGAGFLGGVSSPSGNSSSGALMWDMPEREKSETRKVIDEVAARGNLKSIGLLMGSTESQATEAGKKALVAAAKFLKAANDNRKIRAEAKFRDAS